MSDGAETNRTQRAALTALANIVLQAVSLIAAFLVTPFIVAGLGTELYGAWRMIRQMTAYLVFNDLGGANAIKWTLAHDLASSDIEAKRRQIGAVLAIWSRVALITLAGGAVIVVLSPYIVQVHDTSPWTIVMATGAMVFNFALATLVTLPNAVLRGMNLEYRALFVNAMAIASPTILGGVAVLLGFGLVGLAVGQIAGSVVLGLSRWWVAHHVLPWFGASRASREEKRRLLSLSVWLLGWGLVRRLLLATDVLLMGMLFSAKFAGTYSLTGFLCVATQGPLFAILAAGNPGVGDLIGRGEWRRVEEVRRLNVAVTWTLIVPTAATLIALNHDFLDLWIGAGHYAGDLVNIFLVVLSAQFILLRVDANIIDATLEIKGKTLFGAAVSLSSLGLAVLLGLVFGVLGTLAGLFLGRFVLMWRYSVITRQKIGDSLSARLVQTTRALATAIAICSIALFVPRDFSADSWLLVGASAAACALLSATLFWFLGLSRSDRAAILIRLRVVLKRR